MRDCDVIHVAPHEWRGASDALFTAVTPDGKGESEHRDYLFENIRVEAPAALLAVDWPQATLRNFRFKNITIAENSGRNRLRGTGDAIVFENVRIDGQAATKAADLNLSLEGEMKGVRFVPAAPLPP